eukprot:gene1964-biopygen947
MIWTDSLIAFANMERKLIAEPTLLNNLFELGPSHRGGAQVEALEQGARAQQGAQRLVADAPAAPEVRGDQQALALRGELREGRLPEVDEPRELEVRQPGRAELGDVAEDAVDVRVAEVAEPPRRSVELAEPADRQPPQRRRRAGVSERGDHNVLRDTP